MSATPNVYAKARRDTADLLHYDLNSLTAGQSLRLDCAVALRLALDDLQGRVVRGESVDVSKMLIAAEALSRLLPPAVLASPPPEEDSVDPRQVMWATYLGMRQRGELGEKVREPSLLDRIAQLEAENAALKAAGVPATAVEATPPAPLPDNVVPLSNPAAAAPAAPPKPAPSSVVVLEPANEPWRSFLGPDGSISPTPGGRWWGPV